MRFFYFRISPDDRARGVNRRTDEEEAEEEEEREEEHSEEPEESESKQERRLRGRRGGEGRRDRHSGIAIPGKRPGRRDFSFNSARVFPLSDAREGAAEKRANDFSNLLAPERERRPKRLGEGGGRSGTDRGKRRILGAFTRRGLHKAPVFNAAERERPPRARRFTLPSY